MLYTMGDSTHSLYTPHQTPPSIPRPISIDDNLPQDLSMPKIDARNLDLSSSNSIDSSGYTSRESISPLIVVT